MGLITLLRGFKVPIAVLDRFLVAYGVEETYGIAPRLEPGPLAPLLDPQSAFLRARLAAAGTASTSYPPSPALDGVRLFIPNRRGQAVCEGGECVVALSLDIYLEMGTSTFFFGFGFFGLEMRCLLTDGF